MSDKIVYTITESGVDGRGPTNVVFATWREQLRDNTLDNISSSNRGWYSKGKHIVEIESATKQALAKLDGVQKLLLDIDQKILK